MLKSEFFPGFWQNFVEEVPIDMTFRFQYEGKIFIAFQFLEFTKYYFSERRNKFPLIKKSCQPCHNNKQSRLVYAGPSATRERERFSRASFQNLSKLWDYIKETNTTHFWAAYLHLALYSEQY
jgi:hypothetical protein